MCIWTAGRSQAFRQCKLYASEGYAASVSYDRRQCGPSPSIKARRKRRPGKRCSLIFRNRPGGNTEKISGPALRRDAPESSLLRTYLFSQKLALLDEPFSALDTLTKSAMHKWYLQVMEQIHLSTIFITHDIDEAVLLSDRIYLLTGRPGRITEEIHIREPRPRRSDFNLTDEFLSYKRQILEKLDMGQE